LSIHSTHRPGLLCGIALLLATGNVLAQTAAQPSGESPQAAPAATAHDRQANDAKAEDDKTPKRQWKIEPRLSITETFSDNILLRNRDPRADWVTDLAPGLRVSGEGKHLQAYFDYSLHEMVYARNSNGRRSQNALNTFGKFEAVDNLLYLDWSGVIGQQNISALGQQSANPANVNANQTETSSLRLSPYLKGRLGGSADYEVRYSTSILHTALNSASDIYQRGWTANIHGTTGLSWLLWGIDGDWQTASYSFGRESEAGHIGGKLTWMADDNVRVSLLAGREENNFLSLDKESNVTYGIGLNWTPTPRTKIAAERVKRFFGTGHRFSFEHRTPRTVTSFSESRDVAGTTTHNLGGGSIGNIYDLLYTQFASIEPDPVNRAALVNGFLLANNIAPNTLITSGFLNSGPTLQRMRNLAFSLVGARNTLTLVAAQSEIQRLGILANGNEDLANAPTVRQRGFNVTLSHNLTPLTHLNILGSQQNSSALNSSQETKMRTLSATLNSRIGARTSASLGARRTLYQSLGAPYSENAVIGTLSLQY